MKIKFNGSCHCRLISFEFLSQSKVSVIMCNCSICSSINYFHLIIPHKDFTLIKGRNNIVAYEFGKKIAKHYFCKNCGIKSFYQPRSHLDSYSVNLKCVENPPEIKSVIQFDGKNYEEALKKLKKNKKNV